MADEPARAAHSQIILDVPSTLYNSRRDDDGKLDSRTRLDIEILLGSNVLPRFVGSSSGTDGGDRSAVTGRSRRGRSEAIPAALPSTDIGSAMDGTPLDALVVCDVLYFDGTIPTLFITDSEDDRSQGYLHPVPLPNAELSFNPARGVLRLSLLPKSLPITSVHANRPFIIAVMLAGTEIVTTRQFCVFAKQPNAPPRRNVPPIQRANKAVRVVHRSGGDSGPRAESLLRIHAAIAAFTHSLSASEVADRACAALTTFLTAAASSASPAGSGDLVVSSDEYMTAADALLAALRGGEAAPPSAPGIGDSAQELTITLNEVTDSNGILGTTTRSLAAAGVSRRTGVAASPQAAAAAASSTGSHLPSSSSAASSSSSSSASAFMPSGASSRASAGSPVDSVRMRPLRPQVAAAGAALASSAVAAGAQTPLASGALGGSGPKSLSHSSRGSYASLPAPPSPLPFLHHHTQHGHPQQQQQQQQHHHHHHHQQVQHYLGSGGGASMPASSLPGSGATGLGGKAASVMAGTASGSPPPHSLHAYPGLGSSLDRRSSAMVGYSVADGSPIDPGMTSASRYGHYLPNLGGAGPLATLDALQGRLPSGGWALASGAPTYIAELPASHSPVPPAVLASAFLQAAALSQRGVPPPSRQDDQLGALAGAAFRMQQQSQAAGQHGAHHSHGALQASPSASSSRFASPAMHMSIPASTASAGRGGVATSSGGFMDSSVLDSAILGIGSQAPPSGTMSGFLGSSDTAPPSPMSAYLDRSEGVVHGPTSTAPLLFPADAAPPTPSPAPSDRSASASPAARLLTFPASDASPVPPHAALHLPGSKPGSSAGRNPSGMALARAEVEHLASVPRDGEAATLGDLAHAPESAFDWAPPALSRGFDLRSGPSDSMHPFPHGDSASSSLDDMGSAVSGPDGTVPRTTFAVGTAAIAARRRSRPLVATQQRSAMSAADLRSLHTQLPLPGAYDSDPMDDTLAGPLTREPSDSTLMPPPAARIAPVAVRRSLSVDEGMDLFDDGLLDARDLFGPSSSSSSVQAAIAPPPVSAALLASNRMPAPESAGSTAATASASSHPSMGRPHDAELSAFSPPMDGDPSSRQHDMPGPHSFSNGWAPPSKRPRSPASQSMTYGQDGKRLADASRVHVASGGVEADRIAGQGVDEQDAASSMPSIGQAIAETLIHASASEGAFPITDALAPRQDSTGRETVSGKLVREISSLSNTDMLQALVLAAEVKSRTTSHQERLYRLGITAQQQNHLALLQQQQQQQQQAAQGGLSLDPAFVTSGVTSVTAGTGTGLMIAPTLTGSRSSNSLSTAASNAAPAAAMRRAGPSVSALLGARTGSVEDLVHNAAAAAAAAAVVARGPLMASPQQIGLSLTSPAGPVAQVAGNHSSMPLLDLHSNSAINARIHALSSHFSPPGARMDPPPPPPPPPQEQAFSSPGRGRSSRAASDLDDGADGDTYGVSTVTSRLFQGQSASRVDQELMMRDADGDVLPGSLQGLIDGDSLMP